MPNRPLIIAHRGASAEAPENTIEAFERAIEIGADAIELDVRLSADGLPGSISCHRMDSVPALLRLRPALCIRPGVGAG